MIKGPPVTEDDLLLPAIRPFYVKEGPHHRKVSGARDGISPIKEMSIGFTDNIPRKLFLSLGKIR